MLAMKIFPSHPESKRHRANSLTGWLSPLPERQRPVSALELVEISEIDLEQTHKFSLWSLSLQVVADLHQVESVPSSAL